MEASLTSLVDELSRQRDQLEKEVAKRKRAEAALLESERESRLIEGARKGSESDLKLIIDTHPALAWAEPNDGSGGTFAFAIPCAVERTV